MQKYAVIVAGGAGSRMGGGIPKQFRSLCGRPVVWWSMKAFKEADPATRLIMVLPEVFIDLWEDYFATLPEEDRFEHEVVSGGDNRTESVKNGLKKVSCENSLVAIHDGARPLVSKDLLIKGWEAASESQAAIPIVAVTDSLRKIDEDGNKAVDRSRYVAVQTPQVFRSGLLIEAYEKGGDGSFTDDASVVENFGHSIALFPGDPNNIKITNPKDMILAEALMGKNG